jgi:CRISPR-associated endonuclease/helicase Cas3
MPPRAAEAIELPLWAVQRWLKGADRADDLADTPERTPEERSAPGRPAFRWAGADEPRTGPVAPDDLRPGDALVVPAAYGGCDEWGWNPDPARTAPTTDVADAAARPFAGRRFVVRVHEGLAGEAWVRLEAALAEHAEEGPEALVQALIDARPEPLLAEALRELRDERRGGSRARLERPHFVYGYTRDRVRGVVLVAPCGLETVTAAEREAAPATEDDALGAKTRGRPITIDRHCQDVAGKALGFARGMGLPETLGADLALAGFLHDAGKADRRFQAMLAGGDRLNLPDAPLAKSNRAWGPDAATRAGLPKRWRHEALSVRLAPLHPRFWDAADPALVLWLIGAHHGRGRPFFPHADDQDNGEAERAIFGCLGMEMWPLPSGPGPQDLSWTLEAGDPLDGSDWARLFAGLRRRYGVWGLARLEAALRLADHRASEAKQEDAP